MGLSSGGAALLLLVSRHLFVGVLCVSGDVDWGAWLLAAVVQADCMGSVRRMRLMWRRLSILSTLPLLQNFFLRQGVKSVADVLEGMSSARFFSEQMGCAALSVVRSLRAPALLGALGALDSFRFIQIGRLMLCGCLMILFGRWLWFVGILVCVVGPTGCGRIWDLGPTRFVLRSPCLVIRDKVAKNSQIMFEPHLVDAEFRKAWMPFFCRSGHPVVTVEQFLQFVDPFFLRNLFWTCQGLLTGQDPLVLARQRSLRLVVWMGGPGMRSSHCPWCGSLDWLFSIIWWRLMLFGPRGLQGACI